MPQEARGGQHWLRHAPVGFLIGAATVLLAARPSGGWRLDLYFGVSALSGFYLGRAASGDWGLRTCAAAIGHFVAAFAWAWPYLRTGDGLALYYPMFQVPGAVGVMVFVAIAVGVIRLRRHVETPTNDERTP